MTTILTFTIVAVSTMLVVTMGCALWLDRNEAGRLVRLGAAAGRHPHLPSRTHPSKAPQADYAGEGFARATIGRRLTVTAT
jgi:hypothetical protein